MKLFDSHCHIQVIGSNEGGHTADLWTESGLSLKQVIDHAHKNGVDELMVVGCYLEESQLAIVLAAKEKNIYAAIGIHPHEADRYVNEPVLLKQFSDLATKKEVKAVGETGLDYYYGHSTKDNQKKLLVFQLELAIKHNLPLIFHVRDAFDDFWPIFDQYNPIDKPIRGVLHSYTDNSDNLQIALKNNLYIGVNGIATFSKDSQQLDVYESIPLKSLVLETDSPYLAPVPLRGNINEPSNVVLVAQFLAKLRGESLEKLAKATTDNARQLFGVIAQAS